MRIQRLVVLATLSLMPAAPTVAQRLSADFPRFQPRLSVLQQPDTAPKPPPTMGKDYTQEGAAIGGIATGLLFAHVAVGFCSDPDSNTSGGSCVLPALEGLVIGAVPGVVIGGVVGSLIPKTPK